MIDQFKTRALCKSKSWPSVFLRWDNSPRRKRGAWVFHGCTPEAYEWTLSQAVIDVQRLPVEQRFVFINGWNEWAEGSYLEPDQQYGHIYGDITRRVATGEILTTPPNPLPVSLSIRNFNFPYWIYKTFFRFNLKPLKRKIKNLKFFPHQKGW
ncbi:MAG: glycoside hydrolase family 99-like domain-containing protein [Holosporales bacterium]